MFKASPVLCTEDRVDQRLPIAVPQGLRRADLRVGQRPLTAMPAEIAEAGFSDLAEFEVLGLFAHLHIAGRSCRSFQKVLRARSTVGNNLSDRFRFANVSIIHHCWRASACARLPFSGKKLLRTEIRNIFSSKEKRAT